MTSLLAYVLFSGFVFYQQLHAKNFQGASKVFGLVLAAFAFVGMVTGFAFMVFCFIKFQWWSPIVVLAVGLLSQFVMIIVERVAPPVFISLAGFVGWPVAAYVMFAYA